MHALDERYRLVRRIGQGGMGQVWEGVQLALDRPVAIKVLRPELTAHPTVVARFEQEARTTSRLRHPNVVTVIDIGRTGSGAHFLVMELLDGETLAQRLAREGRIPPETALDLALQVARGMGAGQGLGLVHRDLKPDNLFLVGDDHVKVLDFGLAVLREGPAVPPPPGRSPVLAAGAALTWSDPASPPSSPAALAAGRSPRLTNPGALLGTPRYMAPEQALGWQVDHRADIYSFGCVLYEMLAGHPPFEADDAFQYLQLHVSAPPQPLQHMLPALPPALTGTVHRLLAKDPSQRPPDWPALAEELRRIASGARPRGAPPLARAEPRPVEEPYRFLRPFTAATRAILFGRDGDARRFRAAWESEERAPVLVLTGASGVGKTSFLHALVVPGLEDTGQQVVVVRGGAQPLDEVRRELLRRLPTDSGRSSERTLPELIEAVVASTGRPVALAVDQLEEIFTAGGSEERERFRADLSAILAWGDDRVRIVIAIREDYLGRLMRTLAPLPVDRFLRTIPLRSLSLHDVAEALEGPGRPGLPVAYRPFAYQEGLAAEIARDLVQDDSGEVGPRVQAVGARLWEMVREDPEPLVTREHYRDRLGGAAGIIGRLLDEAIGDLDPADRGVAKELLRALTHLPGAPSSRPAPVSELLGATPDRERRARVLERLESRWRLVHGYEDPRYPGERTCRLAHEALISRIREYGEEHSERNRARRIFMHGLSMWLRGGQREVDLLPETHFDLVLRHAQDLVLRSQEEHTFFEACQRLHNEAWQRRYKAERRARHRRRLLSVALPSALVAAGFLLGQAPVQFRSLRLARLRLLVALGAPAPDFRGTSLPGADLSGLFLLAADFRGAELRNADLEDATLEVAHLEGADLGGASLRGANLRGAVLDHARIDGARLANADLRGASLDTRLTADFTGALFDEGTSFGGRGTPPGAVGPGGDARGADLHGAQLRALDLAEMNLAGADIEGASLWGSSAWRADLTGVRAAGADLQGARLAEASLRDADLSRAILHGAELANADLRGANLRGASLVAADLRGALLDGAHLEGSYADTRTRWDPDSDPGRRGVLLLRPKALLVAAELRGARLGGVSMAGIDLTGADLRGADLSAARLPGAVLVRADLRRASLEAADLRGADLCGADLRGASWQGASWDHVHTCSTTRGRPGAGLLAVER